MSDHKPLPSIHEKLRDPPIDYVGERVGNKFPSLERTKEPHLRNLSAEDLSKRVLFQYKSLKQAFNPAVLGNNHVLLPLYGFTEKEVAQITQGENVAQDPVSAPTTKNEETSSLVFVDCNNMKSNYQTRQTVFQPRPIGRVTPPPQQIAARSTFNPLPPVSHGYDHEITNGNRQWEQADSHFGDLVRRSGIGQSFITQQQNEQSLHAINQIKRINSPKYDKNNNALNATENFEPVQYVPKSNSTSPQKKKSRRKKQEQGDYEFENPLGSEARVPLRRSARTRKKISYKIPHESDIEASDSEAEQSDSDVQSSSTGDDEDSVIQFLANPPIMDTTSSESEGENSEDIDIDVIVVGAGISGVTAAKHLQQKGAKVIVLEARGRLGGRIHTLYSEDSTSDKKEDATNKEQKFSVNIDVGGILIESTASDFIELSEKLGLTFVPVTLQDITLYSMEDKIPSIEIKKAYNDILADAGELYKKGAGTQIPSSSDPETTLSLSTASVYDVIHYLVESGDYNNVKKYLDWFWAFTEGRIGSPLAASSFTNFYENYVPDIKYTMVKQGLLQLIKSFAEGLTIHLDTVVSAIRTTKNGTLVLTNKNTYKCKQVLLTVPLGVLQREQILFSPQLPDWKTNAIQKTGFGLVNTAALIFPKVFWPNFTVIGATSKNPFYLLNIYKCTKQTILLALFTGQHALDMEKKTDAQITDQIMSFLKTQFSNAVAPEYSVVTRWNQDQFARGTHSYIKPEYATENSRAFLAKPVNNTIFFAGEATNRPTITGAYESGKRAAQEMYNEKLETSSDSAVDI